MHVYRWWNWEKRGRPREDTCLEKARHLILHGGQSKGDLPLQCPSVQRLGEVAVFCKYPVLN